MRILVSDTSVLIDFERGGFLDCCFKLPFEFAVPDLLYTRELEAFGGPALVARGLLVQELTGEEVTVAQNARTARPKLSLPDAFAYALASTRGWTLLTGDGELRTLAKAQRVPFLACYGCSTSSSIPACPTRRGLLLVSRPSPRTRDAGCHAQKCRCGLSAIAKEANERCLPHRGSAHLADL